MGDAPRWNIGRGRPIPSLMDDTPHHRRPADWEPPMPSEAELLASSPRAKPSLPPGRSCPATKCCANWTSASPAWTRSVRAGRFAGPLPVVDRADARGQAARPGAVCVLRGTRSAGGGARPEERAHCCLGENHHFVGGWPARATALPAACPTGQGMAQVRALLDCLPDPTHNRHRRRLFRDGEHSRPHAAWLDRLNVVARKQIAEIESRIVVKNDPGQARPYGRRRWRIRFAYQTQEAPTVVEIADTH